MKIHEYQAKEIFRKFGIPVPPGKVAGTPEEAAAAAAQIGGDVVVKAQVHAGGRGKGGGVKKASNPAEAKIAAEAIIGMNLVTHQTGPQGRLVRKVLVEKASPYEAEFYAGLVLDRERGAVTFIASSAGGMEIETVARTSPEKIIRESVDPMMGMTSFQGRRLAYGLGLKGKAASNAASVFQKLYRAFVESDASMAEINPLVLSGENVLALDAKMNIDDSALYRRADLAGMRDPDEEDARERKAQEARISYVSLDGDIGCMVNGAGLAMATMDIIKHEGGTPANFLDVGGGADEKQVKAAFGLILQDPKVKAILVNIFGGIMRCDTIAAGVMAAASEMELKVPVVVRLEGTNVAEGKEMLKNSKLRLITAEDMGDAARKVVAAAKG